MYLWHVQGEKTHDLKTHDNSCRDMSGTYYMKIALNVPRRQLILALSLCPNYSVLEFGRRM